jgi:hypothetical protein
VRAQTNSQTYQKRTQRKRGKHKGLGYRFFAWLEEGSKEIDFQAGCEVSKRRVYCHAINRFLHTRTADWISISSFSHAFRVVVTDTLEDGSKINCRELGKRTENLEYMFLCPLDFDGSEYLTEDVIIQRCNFLGLPLPTYIIKTRPGHFQALWILKVPLKKSQVTYWQAVVDALFKAFSGCEEDKELFGCDFRVLNPVWYVRNPYNRKYQRFDTGRKVSLSELYRALKDAGVVQSKGQGSAKPRRKGQIPSPVSEHRIIDFLHANNGIITTYREFFRACNVKESTGYKLLNGLKREGKITVETVRTGRTWKTKFTLNFHTLTKDKRKAFSFVGGVVVDSLVEEDGSFSGEEREETYTKKEDEVHSKKYEDTHTSKGDKDIHINSFFYPEEEELSVLFDNTGIKGSVFVELARIIAKVGFPFRWRNKGTFMVSLGLKLRGFRESDVLKLLTPGFYLCQNIGDHEFSREEFERTVKSAFRFKYMRCVGFKNSKWEWKGFLKEVYKLWREFERTK